MGEGAWDCHVAALPKSKFKKLKKKVL